VISIIIPTHNQGSSLVKTLVGLERQTFENFEVIVVDAGSADDTENLLNQYSRLSPPLVLKRLKIEGSDLDMARRVGVESANGKKILFLSPGGEMSVNALAELDNALKNKFKSFAYTDCHNSPFYIDETITIRLICPLFRRSSLEKMFPKKEYLGTLDPKRGVFIENLFGVVSKKYKPVAKFGEKRKLFKKIKIACLNDHYNLLGGGTIHAFKFLEYLKDYYSINLYLPGKPKSDKWMKKYLRLNTDGLLIFSDDSNMRNSDNYLFLNISHWRLTPTSAKKKWALIFFPHHKVEVDGYNFLANSIYTKQQIQRKWKVSAKRVKVVYPPMMLSNFSPKRKKNLILHVSRIHIPEIDCDKGHLSMIEAFKKMVDGGLKDWEFHFVGQVEHKDYYVELLEAAQCYPIRIHKSLPFSRLKELYGEAKIYWHMTGINFPKKPAAKEHFGMTIVEAMASGTIPISYDAGGPREIIENGKSGFLVKDADELINQTLSLMRNDDLMQKMQGGVLERCKFFDEEKSRLALFSALTNIDKVTIIILCHNNLRYTKKCIKRLLHVTPPGFQMILVDNGSKDGTKEYLQELEKEHDFIKCIYSNRNLGFAKANNLALELAETPYVCYLNNDTEPQWGWLERMVDVLEENPKAGIVGARMYFPNSNPVKKGWTVQHAGISYDVFKPPDCVGRHIGHHQLDREVPGKGATSVDSVTGACMLVRKEIAKFDEIYERGYFEDNDLCLSAKKNGWSVFIEHDATLIHHEGKTQGKFKEQDPKGFKRIAEKNRKIFLKKWSGYLRKLSGRQ